MDELQTSPDDGSMGYYLLWTKGADMTNVDPKAIYVKNWAVLVSFASGQARAEDWLFEGRLVIEAVDGELRGPRVESGDGRGEVWDPIWGERHHIRRWEITSDQLDLNIFQYFGVSALPRSGYVVQHELTEAEREALPDMTQDFEFNLEAREPPLLGNLGNGYAPRNYIRVLFQLSLHRSRGVSLSSNPYGAWFVRVLAESSPRRLIGPIEGVVPWSFQLDDFDPFPPTPLELMPDGEEREPEFDPIPVQELPSMSVGSEPTGAPRFEREDLFESESWCSSTSQMAGQPHTWIVTKGALLLRVWTEPFTLRVAH